MNLEGKTALITGGCGLVGSTIADQLVRAKVARIIILDNLVRGTRHNIQWARENGNIELVTKDIREYDQIRPYFEGVDVVFHQAAIRITMCAEQPRECLDVLVTGSLNVALACVEAKVPRLVAASSGSVYGAADVFPTDEKHHPYNNRTWYGAAKLASEGLYRALHDTHGLDYVALRYFNVYGPRMDVFGKYTEVLIRWLDCLDRGESPKIYGAGNATMDLVFSEDVARCNLLAAGSDVVDEVFNVASGVEISMLQLLEVLLQVTGRTEVKPEFLPERKVNSMPRRLGDTSKAARLLHFRAEVALAEGLSRLVQWRKQVIAAQRYGEYAP